MVVPLQAFSISFLLFLSFSASFRPTSALAGGREEELSQKALAGPEVHPESQKTLTGFEYNPIVHPNDSVGAGWQGPNGVVWYPRTVKKIPVLTKKFEGRAFKTVNVPFEDAKKYCNDLGMRIPTSLEWIDLGGSMGGESEEWHYPRVRAYTGRGYQPQIFPEALKSGKFFIAENRGYVFDGKSGEGVKMKDPSETLVLCVEDREMFTARIGVRESQGFKLQEVNEEVENGKRTGFIPERVQHSWKKVNHRTSSGSTLTGWQDPSGRQWFETEFFGDRLEAVNYCKDLGLEFPPVEDFQALGIYLGAQILPKYREAPSGPEDVIEQKCYQTQWTTFVFKPHSWMKNTIVNECFPNGPIGSNFCSYRPQVFSSLSEPKVDGQGSAEFWSSSRDERGMFYFEGNSGDIRSGEWYSKRRALCIKKPQ